MTSGTQVDRKLRRSAVVIENTRLLNELRESLEQQSQPHQQLAELAPDQARYAYVYGVTLHSNGRGGEALTVLDANLARHPNDRDTLLALVSFNRDAGDAVTALAYAERLARIEPTDRNLAGLIESLRRQANNY